LAILVVEISETSSKVGELWCSNEVVVEVLNHNTRELDILVLRKAIGHGSVYALSTQCYAELSDDEVATSFEESTVCTEQLQEINHE